MQTFLPYPDFYRSAKVLDMRRLGKQRVETKQILTALRQPNYGWQNHPAVSMWRGCDTALIDYGIAVCTTWRERGYQDTLLPFFEEQVRNRLLILPSWLCDRKFHLSHKSNLLRKQPDHYRQFWPRLSADLPYVWPTQTRRST